MRSDEIAWQQFINYHILGVGWFKVGYLPIVRRRTVLNIAHNVTNLTGAARISLYIWINRGGDILVIRRIENFVAIGVCNLYASVDEIFIRIFRARTQVIHLYPPAGPVC